MKRPAETHCPNGEVKECEGEFKAYADESGVRCIDTQGDPGSRDFC